MTTIQERVRGILSEVPPEVTVLAAAKGATIEALDAAMEAGIYVVGHNHISEARATRAAITQPAEWHFIGTMTPHAVRASTLHLFDMVQSVSSIELAQRIDALCARDSRRVRVLIEVNSGREPQKSGVLPEFVETMARELSRLEHIRVEGLMTMGPSSTEPASYRACFAETCQLFKHLGTLGIPGIRMRHLSMGMSASYQVAIEEGATMIRLGTVIFGPR
ncbi:MAG: YggS family pyridoxal phosphate-dependent enzyme [Dehalococcoidia bacterium]|nr:YggS family pyridoxal phosphate-dependent enzyme [Dehalococcoidia bacterium]